jgi:copper chaperone CopZ
MEATLRVPKIRCEGCAETITAALGRLDGVSGTRVTVAAKAVRVEFDAARVDEPAIRRALAGAGFPAE